MNNVDKRQEQIAELARRIRQARDELHLSQAELAASVGVSDKSISAYEKGRAVPPIKVLKHIADQTKRTLSFFTEEDNQEQNLAAKVAIIEEQLAEIKKLMQKDS